MKNSIINFIKGILIGIGALLPGLSGGALAAIFGIYEPFIAFASNIKKDFKANIKFFAPVIFGGLFGIFLLSHLLSYFLEHNLPEISIFFVGCMLGIFPNLVGQAGAKGRDPIHLVITVFVAIGAFLFFSRTFDTSQAIIPAAIGTGTWIASGSIIGLGVTFPGLSPSNFLMYLNLYHPLNIAISQLNFQILIPVAIGGILSVILTAKLISYLLKIAYQVVYHVILGLVLTSTVMILPRDFNSPLIIGLCLFAGLVVGNVMSRLEKQDHLG